MYYLGNLQNWWDDETKAKFLNKTKCIIDQYSKYEVKELDVSLNGVTTQGENIADNGGVKEAYKAYRKSIFESIFKNILQKLFCVLKIKKVESVTSIDLDPKLIFFLQKNGCPDMEKNKDCQV